MFRSSVAKLRCVEFTLIKQRNASTQIDSYQRLGTGGRSSFNGVVATVFGATGILGRYVVNRLAQCGTQIIVPHRGIDMDLRPLRVMGDLGQIKFMDFNLKDKDSIAAAVSHSNTVINLIGRNHPTRNFTFEECLVKGAKDIASAAKAAGAEKMIHISHLSAAGNSSSLYLQAKARSERAVAEAFKDVIIMKPADMISNEDRYLNKYAYMRRLPFGLIPLVDNGWNTIKRPVHVSDVAQAIVNASLDPSTVGKTFELYGPEAYYLKDIVDFVYKLIKDTHRTFHIPLSVYEKVGWLFEQSIFSPKFSRDLVRREFTSEEVHDDMPSFEDLGIMPLSINEVAGDILRRHRHFLRHNDIIDESDVCITASERG